MNHQCKDCGCIKRECECEYEVKPTLELDKVQTSSKYGRSYLTGKIALADVRQHSIEFTDEQIAKAKAYWTNK